MKKSFGVGVVGAGLIGGKRAEAILKTHKGTLVAVTDIVPARAAALAQKHGAALEKDWRQPVRRKDIDAVVVAVPNAFAAPIAEHGQLGYEKSAGEVIEKTVNRGRSLHWPPL
jgi:predicted dehydrogenase